MSTELQRTTHSRRDNTYLGVAQSVEYSLWKREVGGSSPLTQTNFIQVAYV